MGELDREKIEEELDGTAVLPATGRVAVDDEITECETRK